MTRIELQSKLLLPTKYSKWYLNIIENANSQNRKKLKKLNEDYQYYENHHILPEALFKEYKDLKLHSWNGVLLTAKEHFISHRLIQKHYQKIKYTLGDMKMSRAIDMMSKFTKYNSKHYEDFKLNLSHSAETKNKISINNKGKNRGNKHSKETKDKISQSHKGKIRSKIHIENNRKAQTGKKLSIETKEKISEKSKLQMHTDKRKQEASIKMSGEGNPMFGVRHTDEYKLKMSKKLKGVEKGHQEVVKCPFCSKEGGTGAMKRWHFDNCKFK